MVCRLKIKKEENIYNKTSSSSKEHERTPEPELARN
jgi:hypothetical protein